MSKQYGGKCCCCINLKTGCYIIAFILLIVQSVLFDMAVNQFVVTITLTTRAFDMNVKDPQLYFKVLSYIIFAMIILAIAITIVVFTVILLIGLYKENRKYIGMYLIYGTIMLLAFVLVCVIQSFFKRIDDLYERSIWIILNSYFIYIIKCYWITIHPDDEKEQEAKV